MEAEKTKVFISYSHDNPEHKARVLTLADWLRDPGGLACKIDQYELNPSLGWPRWCEKKIEESRFVLVVCTPTYLERFNNEFPNGTGKGVKFEGYVITQQFYDNGSLNDKFIPVLFSAGDELHIPTILKGASRFRVDTEDGYLDLYRLLSNQPAVVMPDLGPGLNLPIGQNLSKASRPTLSGTSHPHNLPYPSLATLFKGRDPFLAELHQRLQTGRPVGVVTRQAVYGLGGIGKTRVAVEYAWRHRDAYTALLFVPSPSPEELQRNLADLCNPLGLGLDPATPEGEQVAAVLRRLEKQPGWLLILDNVDTEAAAVAVEKLLGRLTQGKVIITSRLSNWSGAVRTMELQLLAPADAAAFLLERTADRRASGADDVETAASLAEALGYLALALEQAGAFICQHRCALADYLARWREMDSRVREWFDPRLMQYPQSVATTWETSFSQLDQPARDLLYQLAWLAPEPMPQWLFPEGAEAGLTQLVSYSLATWDQGSGQPMLRVHRLVQEVTQQRIPDGEKKDWIGSTLQLVDSATPGNPQDARNWPAWDLLRPHAATVIELADRQEIAGPTGHLLNQLGILFEARALYRMAEPLFRRALAIDEKSLGPDNLEVASYLNNLAALFQATNRPQEAEPLYRRALNISEKSLGPDHPTVATHLNNLAELFRATNRLQEAEPLFRRALAIDENSLGSNHPDVAIDLNNLAGLLQDTNRPQEAEPLFRRALAIDENSFGLYHPNVASRLNSLAALLRATNRLREAEPLYHRALAIDENILGLDHPYVAIRLNNLAELFQATNRFHEAEPLFRRALSIAENSLGSDHPEVAIGLNNLAGLFLATNRLREAEPLSRRQLQIFLRFGRATGHQHPCMVTAINNYAWLLQAMGEGDEEIRAKLRNLLN